MSGRKASTVRFDGHVDARFCETSPIARTSVNESNLGYVGDEERFASSLPGCWSSTLREMSLAQQSPRRFALVGLGDEDRPEHTVEPVSSALQTLKVAAIVPAMLLVSEF